MEILLFWLALCIVIAVIADSKNRNWFGFLVLSLFLSPVIGILLVICLPALPEKGTEPPPTKQGCNDEKGKRKGKWKVDANMVAVDTVAVTHKPCPYCAEEVLIAAIKCKHCQSSLV